MAGSQEDADQPSIEQVYALLQRDGVEPGPDGYGVAALNAALDTERRRGHTRRGYGASADEARAPVSIVDDLTPDGRRRPR